MILFTINDLLSDEKSKFLQCVESKEILKREMLARYRDALKNEKLGDIEKLKDIEITFFGSFDGSKIALDKNVIKLTDFIGVKK